jgi:ribonuclease BN (tRNA processing enzyme)
VHGPGLRLRALGVAGAPAPGRLTTTFELTGGLIVDTGAAAHGLAPAEREGITDVLLSHAHLDHTLGLPFLLAGGTPRVHGLPATLDAVRESLLDGRIWPPLHHRAEWRELDPSSRVEVGDWEVTTLPAAHTVPCLSFVFSRLGMADPLAIVGDTRLDDEVVAGIAAERPAHCVVEVSYPDADAEIAIRYGHQTPRELRVWREALGPDCLLLITHLKPQHGDAVRAECDALDDPRLIVMTDGDVFEL